MSNGENDNMGKLPHKIDLIFAPPPNALKRAWEILCICVFPGVSIYIGTKGLMIFFKLIDVIPFSYNLAFVFSAFLWYLMAICCALLGISLVGVCNKRTYVQNINFNEHFIIMFDENLNRTAIDVDACIVERDVGGLVLFDRKRQIRYSFDRSFYEAHKKNQVVRWKPFLDTFFNGAPLCRMKTSAEGAVVVSPMQASLDVSERPFPVYAVFLPNPFIPMILSEESWLLRRNPFG